MYTHGASGGDADPVTKTSLPFALLGLALSSSSALAGVTVGFGLEAHSDMGGAPSCLTDMDGNAVEPGEVYFPSTSYTRGDGGTVDGRPSAGTCEGGRLRPGGTFHAVLRAPLNDRVRLRAGLGFSHFRYAGIVRWNPDAPSSDYTSERLQSEGQSGWLNSAGLSVGLERSFGEGGLQPYVGAGAALHMGKAHQSLGPRGNVVEGPYDFTQNLVNSYDCHEDGTCSTVNDLPMNGMSMLLGGYVSAGARTSGSVALYGELRYSVMGLAGGQPAYHDADNQAEAGSLVLDPLGLQVGVDFSL